MAKGADRPFPKELLQFFRCQQGAFSPVTAREAYDGQITLTGVEKEIAIAFFGAEALAPYRGNDEELRVLGLDARREFRMFPSGEKVYPKLKYAKSDGNELRLYFNAGEFKAPAGNFWAIFVKDREIWICDFSPWWLEDIISGSASAFNVAIALEPEVDDYQDLANAAPPEEIMVTSTSWKRNPRLAAEAFERTGFVCELRPDLELFTSRKTGKPFVEAHHLIPMKAQSSFVKYSLDCIENICVLSPFVHRKLHHAPFEAIKDDLVRLAASRRALFDRLEISEDFLFSAYQG